ncbi:hypothetical protein TrRE_jg2534 [Triparma retinervis]|uniref:Polycystin cation channel PKD1/PKD2 domain-containing protein n=1 Tax=Triparma retinervis TaxID=2557542 RepID=A0A9W7FCW8_9STRA|nr:hypothetical protein TrRE_jg2534 [Triparma retinervis]
MTPEETLDLSPWAKWILYRKFPYKLLIHLTLVVITTTHVLTINRIFDSYSRAVGSTWASLLFPPGYQTGSERQWGMGYELYTVPSTLSHAQHLMESYYSLPYLAVDTVTIHDDPYVVGGNIGTPTLEIVRSGEETGTTMETNETVYEIEDPDKGWPLAKDEALQRAYENADIETLCWSGLVLGSLYMFLITRAVKRQVEIVRVISRERNRKDSKAGGGEERWNKGGGIKAGWSTPRGGGGKDGEGKGGWTGGNWWFNKSKRTGELRIKGREDGTDDDGMKEPLVTPTFGQKDKDALEDGPYRMVLGSATAGLWFSAVQYLEYFPRFYLLIWTLKTGIPRVLQFFVGIAPFFIGYALLGMTLFGDEEELFGDIQSTTCTLFSVVNGDSVLDVFNSLKYAFPIGDIYLYFYIMIFMYVVLMSSERGILGSSPATFQSRLMPAKLREVLRSVSRKGGEESSSEGSSSGSETESEGGGKSGGDDGDRDSDLNSSGFKMDDEEEFVKKGRSSSGRAAGGRMTLGGN